VRSGTTRACFAAAQRAWKANHRPIRWCSPRAFVDPTLGRLVLVAINKRAADRSLDVAVSGFELAGAVEGEVSKAGSPWVPIGGVTQRRTRQVFGCFARCGDAVGVDDRPAATDGGASMREPMLPSGTSRRIRGIPMDVGIGSTERRVGRRIGSTGEAVGRRLRLDRSGGRQAESSTDAAPSTGATAAQAGRRVQVGRQARIRRRRLRVADAAWVRQLRHTFDFQSFLTVALLARRRRNLC